MSRSWLSGGAAALWGTLFLLVLSAPPVQAQQTGAVAGTVSEAGSGEPIVGAEVFLPEAGLGTVTGQDGGFRIEDAPTGETEIRAEMLGFAAASRTVTIQPGETTVQDFTLEISAVALDGLVVTAIGQERRREQGNATTTVQVDEELERITPTTMPDLLQGRASGVTIQQSSGTVGGTSTIRIRGNSSITLNNTPIIYVDGARVSNDVSSGPGVGGQNTSRLNDLNPSEIESIEVVKGPSAATLYGTEASAGVIRITTRQGRSGAAQWTYRSELGANWDDTDWPDNFFNPRAFFGEAVPDTTYRMNLLEQVGTDIDPWRTGIQQTHGLSVRGGFEGFTYFLSGEWNDQEGTLPNNAFEDRSFRANFDIDPSEDVQISVRTGFASNDVSLPDNDNNGFGYIGVALIGFPWEMPIVRDDPATDEEGVETCPIDFEVSRAFGVPLGTQGCSENPFFANRTFNDVETLSNTQDIERYTGSVTLDYQPFDFLNGRATLGYDQFSDQTGSFVPVNPDRPFDDLSEGFRSINNFVHRNLTAETNVSADFDLTPDLLSTTTIGGQFFRESVESAGSTGRFLPTGTQTVSNAVRTEGFENVVETRTAGFFVQQQFAFQDRLFVTPAIRFDDNSAFGENLGLQEYPRVMASWVVSEEGWFPEPDFLESLRLRGAWGQSGKQPSSFDALQLMSADRVTFRDEDRAGLSLTRPANPDLRPETGEEVELGFEADILEGRFGLGFTWYRQETSDAIVARELAPSTGFSGNQFTNVGEMLNRGIELDLNALVVDHRSVQWDWTLNLATNENEVTKLDEPIIFGFNSAQRHQEGLPFAAYFHPDAVIGEDGEAEVTDDMLLGHPTPELEGSVSTSVRLWDRVTLHANLGFAGGHQLVDNTEEFMCSFLGGGTYGGTCGALHQRDADGDPTDEAKIKAAASTEGIIGPYVYDADFARLRTVSARFELPDALVSPIGADRASITLSGQNLALFTDYPGLDPEITAGGGAQAFRAEFLTLPPAKRFTGRFSITF